MNKFDPLKHPVCLSIPKRLTAESTWRQHIPFAMALTDIARPAVIVELGTQNGDSYCAFCQAVTELQLPTLCYAVDTWQGDPQTGFYGPEVLEDLKRHHDPLYSGFSQLILSSFDEAVKKFPDNSIDILHIDGNHLYENVKHDFETWLPRMKSSGLILLHDIDVRENDFGVYRFWEEVKILHPHFEFPHSQGLGILAVSKDYPAGLRFLFNATQTATDAIRQFFLLLGNSVEGEFLNEHRLGEARQIIYAREQLLRKEESTIIELRGVIDQKEIQINDISRNLHAKINEIANQAVLFQQQLVAIQQSISWRSTAWLRKLVELSLPPGSQRRILVGAVLHFFSSTFYKKENAKRGEPKQGGSLVYKINSGLDRPIEVGRKNILMLEGWCYHTVKEIKRLCIRIGEKPYKVNNWKLPRTDVFLDQCQALMDTKGNSLKSGFWIFIPLDSSDAPYDVDVFLEATLRDKQQCVLKVGEIKYVIPEDNKVKFQSGAAISQTNEPLVAICMGTYNPPLHLFKRQIGSILEQSHKNWICIINDDGSRPEIYEEIIKIIDNDPRFYISRNATNLGFYYNFESCLRRIPPEAAFIALADQDDCWFQDKIEACLEKFRDDTMLVYSDINIVDSEGTLIYDSFWKFRRNNYTDLAFLLLANTITGAASVFRSELLEYLLPFPAKVGDTFHDWWIGTVALTMGKIAFINRPLYDNYQHSSNALGFFLSSGIDISQNKNVNTKGKNSFINRVIQDAGYSQSVYYYDFRRILLTANTLKSRCSGVAKSKTRILNNFISFDRSTSRLLYQYLEGKIMNRDTLGAEGRLFNGVMVIKMLKIYYWLIRRDFVRKYVAPVVANLSNERIVTSIEAINQKIAPLSIRVDDRIKRRINLLIPEINFSVFFGGYLAKFNLARKLAEKGFNVRIVIVDWTDYDPATWNHELPKYGDFATFFNNVEVEYCFDRSRPLTVSPNDVFIATTWWTAHIAKEAIKQTTCARFLYLIQEYEPFTFPMGTYFALADNSYAFPHFAVFSTELLRGYFRDNGIGVYREGDLQGDNGSLSFQNAILPFDVKEAEIKSRSPKKLFFYARPEAHAARNMYELGAIALSNAIQKGYFAYNEWEFHAIGSSVSGSKLDLGKGASLIFMPKLSLQEYKTMLPQYDLGLSLMLTPHPSLVPLEMASAGMIVVTNSFANKTREALGTISPNFIVAEPNIESIEDALKEASANISEYSRRTDPLRINWCTDWEQSFNSEVMSGIYKFIDRLQGQ